VGPPRNRQVRFGSRGISVPADAVRAADIRRGIAALDLLSREHRGDPAARVACLFYALRSDTGSLTIQILSRLVDERIAAFEWMIANRPQLIAREAPTALFEAAVYEVIAMEPLIVVAGRHRFDSARFISRLDRLLSRHGDMAETPALYMAPG
jgi:hypothetical protein